MVHCSSNFMVLYDCSTLLVIIKIQLQDPAGVGVLAPPRPSLPARPVGMMPAQARMQQYRPAHPPAPVASAGGALQRPPPLNSMQRPQVPFRSVVTHHTWNLPSDDPPAKSFQDHVSMSITVKIAYSRSGNTHQVPFAPMMGEIRRGVLLPEVWGHYYMDLKVISSCVWLLHHFFYYLL